MEDTKTRTAPYDHPSTNPPRLIRVYQRIAELLIAIDNCQKAGNEEWEIRHTERLRQIEREHLPSGSGLDHGPRIDIERTRESLTVIVHCARPGLLIGFATPTEAAAMSAVYAFICAVFIYRDLGMKDVPKVLLNSANMSAMLLYIITNAVLFSFIMTNENIPQALAEWMLGQGLGPIAFLLARSRGGTMSAMIALYFSGWVR